MAAVRTKYRQGSGSVGKPVVIRFQTKNMLEDYAKIGNFLIWGEYRLYPGRTRPCLPCTSEPSKPSESFVSSGSPLEHWLQGCWFWAGSQSSAVSEKLSDLLYSEVHGAEVDLFTLTDSQYLYLLFAQFQALDRSCIIVDQRKEQSLYHRLSHYFALINTDSSYCPDGIQGGRLYDHVLNYNGQRFRRLQKKRIGALQTFPPLIPNL